MSDTRVLHLEITDCMECPYSETREWDAENDDFILYCDKKESKGGSEVLKGLKENLHGRPLPPPDWCPLPKKETTT